MKPVRIALFAPGIKDRVMSKALESGADAVILDLEDSVPVAAKALARTMVAQVIDAVAAAGNSSAPAIFVRTNASATGLLADDLAAMVRPGLEALILPKVESVEEIQGIAAVLSRLEAARNMPDGYPPRKYGLYPHILNPLLKKIDDSTISI